MFFKYGLSIWICLNILFSLAPATILADNANKNLKFHINTIQDSSKTDKWFTKDKGRHLVGSFFLTTLTGMLSSNMQDASRRESKVIGCSIALSIGLGKEIYDSTKINNNFSWIDLSADIIGIILGMIVLGIK